MIILKNLQLLITFNMDGSDDEKFLFPEALNEADSIYDNFVNNINK